MRAYLYIYIYIYMCVCVCVMLHIQQHICDISYLHIFIYLDK